MRCPAAHKEGMYPRWGHPFLPTALFSFLSFPPPKKKNPAGTPPKKKGRRGHGGKRSGGLGERGRGAGPPHRFPKASLSLSPDTTINNRSRLFIPLRRDNAGFHGTTPAALALLPGFWQGVGAFPCYPPPHPPKNTLPPRSPGVTLCRLHAMAACARRHQ